MKIDVESKVHIYKIDGKDTVVGGPKLSVKSNSHFNGAVELDIDGKRIVVSGKDLKLAVDNAMNVGW